MSSEHVEVLREMKGWRMPPIGGSAYNAALDAAIAALSAPQPPAEAQADWKAAPPGATHYQPHQDAYYKRVSASEWYVWSREDDRGLIRWLLSPSTSDSAEWVVRPSEAQPQGGGEVELRHMVAKLAAHVRPTCGELWEEAQATLAQQPAAGGEEIMVNAAHDVYTLPLQPSGLSSGPRFVVHVPGPEQPAAVDGDNPYPAPRNRQEAAALARLALAYLGVTSAHIDAVVARCETDLAGQQGGSDNDR